MFKDELSIVNFTETNFPDKVFEIVDPQLLHELELYQETPTALKEQGVHSLLSMLNIGICCTKSSPSERVNMKEVASMVHAISAAYLREN